jgi:GTP cyclohydrolase II
VTCSDLTYAPVVLTSSTGLRKQSKKHKSSFATRGRSVYYAIADTTARGGSGVVIYFRKEGRALGEVTKV